jgi:hypothetical protein
MALFTPRNGKRALRSVVIDLAARAELGELLTYQRLAQVMELDVSEPGYRHLVQQSANTAKKILLKDHGRTLIAQRGEGYRVAMPGEMADVATTHRTRSERQLVKALDVVTFADTKVMSDAEYQRFQATKLVVVSLHRRMTMAEDRIAMLEEAVFGVSAAAEPPAPRQPQRLEAAPAAVPVPSHKPEPEPQRLDPFTWPSRR